MGILKVVLLVFAGLAGVIATEAGVMVWLTYAPYSLDLTGNFFTLTVVPVVIVVAVLAALLLWKILATNPLRNCLIFSAVYVAAESLGLTLLGNPPAVVATYAALMACVCTAVFLAFSRLFWSRTAP